MSLRLEFNEEIQDALRIPPEEQEPRLRRELALRLYEKGLLSLGKARQLAIMEKWDFLSLLAQEGWDFLSLLAQEGISRQYGISDLDRDLSTLDTLP